MCSRQRKELCLQDDKCSWIVGKGCHKTAKEIPIEHKSPKPTSPIEKPKRVKKNVKETQAPKVPKVLKAPKEPKAPKAPKEPKAPKDAKAPKVPSTRNAKCRGCEEKNAIGELRIAKRSNSPFRQAQTTSKFVENILPNGLLISQVTKSFSLYNTFEMAKAFIPESMIPYLVDKVNKETGQSIIATNITDKNNFMFYVKVLLTKIPPPFRKNVKWDSRISWEDKYLNFAYAPLCQTVNCTLVMKPQNTPQDVDDDYIYDEDGVIFDESIPDVMELHNSLLPLTDKYYLECDQENIQLEDGDVIALQGSGDRNSNVVMYHVVNKIPHLVGLYTNYDDYGSVAPPMEVITKFPINYWNGSRQAGYGRQPIDHNYVVPCPLSDIFNEKMVHEIETWLATQNSNPPAWTNTTNTQSNKTTCQIIHHRCEKTSKPLSYRKMVVFKYDHMVYALAYKTKRQNNKPYLKAPKGWDDDNKTIDIGFYNPGLWKDRKIKYNDGFIPYRHLTLPIIIDKDYNDTLYRLEPTNILFLDESQF